MAGLWGFGLYMGICILGPRVVLGLYGENGKENGNYYNGLYRQGFRL